MKTLSLIFGVAATSIGLACTASMALKAGQDYCSSNPSPTPFIPGNIRAAENHRDFCTVIDTLSTFNPLYPYQQQTPPPAPIVPNVTMSPYSVDPYLGIPGS